MQQSRAITRRSASNLALAFCLLPRTTRDDMSALRTWETPDGLQASF